MNGFQFFLLFFFVKRSNKQYNHVSQNAKFFSAYYIVFLISFDWKNKLKVISTREKKNVGAHSHIKIKCFM